MTTTVQTSIKQITPWIYDDTNEKFSHLEIYFIGQGNKSFRGIRGTQMQIATQLDFDNNLSFECNIKSLIGKKVNVLSDTKESWISGMNIIEPVAGRTQKFPFQVLLKRVAVLFLH